MNCTTQIVRTFAALTMLFVGTISLFSDDPPTTTDNPLVLAIQELGKKDPIKKADVMALRQTVRSHDRKLTKAQLKEAQGALESLLLELENDDYRQLNDESRKDELIDVGVVFTFLKPGTPKVDPAPASGQPPMLGIPNSIAKPEAAAIEAIVTGVMKTEVTNKDAAQRKEIEFGDTKELLAKTTASAEKAKKDQEDLARTQSTIKTAWPQSYDKSVEETLRNYLESLKHKSLAEEPKHTDATSGADKDSVAKREAAHAARMNLISLATTRIGELDKLTKQVALRPAKGHIELRNYVIENTSPPASQLPVTLGFLDREGTQVQSAEVPPPQKHITDQAYCDDSARIKDTGRAGVDVTLPVIISAISSQGKVKSGSGVQTNHFVMVRVPSVIHIADEPQIQSWLNNAAGSRIGSLFTNQFGSIDPKPGHLYAIIEPKSSTSEPMKSEGAQKAEDLWLIETEVRSLRKKIEFWQKLEDENPAEHKSSKDTSAVRSQSGDLIFVLAEIEPDREDGSSALPSSAPLGQAQTARQEKDASDLTSLPKTSVQLPPSMTKDWDNQVNLLKAEDDLTDPYRDVARLYCYIRLAKIATAALNLSEEKKDQDAESKFLLQAQHFVEISLGIAAQLAQTTTASPNLDDRRKQDADRLSQVRQLAAEEALQEILVLAFSGEGNDSIRDVLFQRIRPFKSLSHSVGELTTGTGRLPDGNTVRVPDDHAGYFKLFGEHFSIDASVMDEAKAFEFFQCAYHQFFLVDCDLAKCREALEKAVKLSGHRGLGLYEQYLGLVHYRLGNKELAASIAWSGVIHEEIIGDEHLNLNDFGRERLSGGIRTWIESMRSSTRLTKIREIRRQFLRDVEAENERQLDIIIARQSDAMLKMRRDSLTRRFSKANEDLEAAIREAEELSRRETPSPEVLPQPMTP